MTQLLLIISESVTSFIKKNLNTNTHIHTHPGINSVSETTKGELTHAYNSEVITMISYDLIK